MTKASDKTKNIHQGKLLIAFQEWTGLSKEKFTERLSRSRPWLFHKEKEERLTPATIVAIAKEFKLPKEYFEGKYQLPDERGSMVGEEQSEYGLTIQMLKTENQKLKDENYELLKKVERLQEMVIKMQEDMLNMQLVTRHP